MIAPSRLVSNLGLAVTYLFVVSFYFWTAATSGTAVLPAPVIDEHYNLLAKGYLAGQLSLSATPDPRLVALSDPYDPVSNAPFRIHDAALFNGRYYLYFGPTPALLLFAPFRLATSLDFPQSIATAFFCSAGLLFAFLLLHHFSFCALPRPPSPWFLVASMLALGFCNVAPFLLRRPAMYEVAISCGYALVLASVYCFVSGGLVGQPRIGRLSLGSTLLGLAGGARFPLLAGGIVAVVVAVYQLLEHPKMSIRRRAALLTALLAPVAVCGLLLAWYNYARFGSPTEFGINYTLQGVHPRVYQFFSLRRLPYGFLYYTVVPVQWSATFPFAQLRPELWLPPPSYLYLEPVAGLLAHSPILVVLGALVWVRPAKNKHVVTLLALLLLGFLLLLLFAITGTTMRYEVDFATFFVLPALVLWLHALQNTRLHSVARGGLVGAIFVVLLSVSVLSNLFISFTGYYDNLKNARPHTYETLRGFFSPVERLLLGPADIVRIVAPNGIEQRNGENFFWLGGPPASVLVHSTRAQVVALTATFVPGPSVAPDLQARRVRVVVPALAWSRVVAVRGGPGSVRVPLMKGETVIRIEALDPPTITAQPNGDMRVLVVGIQGLRIGPVP